MPDLPRYNRRVTVTPVGKAPLPVGAADVGAGAIGQGLQAVGQAVGKGASDLGQVLLQIKQEQIALNDAINTTKANAFIESEEKTFANYMSKNDPGIKGDGSPSNWEVEREKSWNQLTKNIEGLQFSLNARKLINGKLSAYSELRDTTIRISQSELLKKQSEAYVALNLQKAIETGDPIKIADATGVFKLNTPTIWGGDKATADAIFRKAMQDGRKEYYIDQSKRPGNQDTIIEEMRANQKALGKSGKDEFGLGFKDYEDVIASAMTEKREIAINLKTLQEETYSQMLADFWNGNLKDVQKITDALNNNLISPTTAKSLREAMLNPDPPKHKLTAETAVLQSIENIGTDSGTKQDAMDILAANIQNLNPEKGSSLLNAIFAAHDKNIAEIKRESRGIMEELIRDKDRFSGLFTDDERQILAYSEAYLMLDAEIQKAAKEGKPLTRRDTMIRATEIGRQMKRKVKNEEGAKIQPTFEPGLPPKTKISSMVRPINMTEFNTAIDALPNEDAKRRYFEKWYKDVPKN